MDPQKVAEDYLSVGLELLDEVGTVKQKGVRSVCVKCGDSVSYSYLHVKQRIKRDTGKKGCRRCAARHDDIEAELRMREAGLEPLEKYPGAGKAWRFRCSSCGETAARRLAEVQVGKGCPHCGKRNRVDPRWITPEKAEQDFRAANLEPLEPYPGKSRMPWRALCLICEKEVAPTLQAVRANGRGCRYCASNAGASSRRRPQSEVEQVFAEKGLTLLSHYKNPAVRVKAVCHACDKESTILVETVESGGGCPFCNGRRVDPLAAAALMRSFGLEPLRPYPGSPKEKWLCKCLKCGNEVTPQFSYARHGRGLCPWCSQRIVDVAAAVELMRTRGLEPLVDFPGSLAPWLCQCQVCGRETSPRYGAIYSKPKGGCKWCADSGVDYTAPAFVYLITNGALGAHKIGITAISSTRLESHRREGWEVFNKVEVIDGYRAKQVEDDVLLWWRNTLGLAHYLIPEQMPQGGFTETVDALEVTLHDTWALVESLVSALSREPS